jgi:hypothetical protein
MPLHELLLVSLQMLHALLVHHAFPSIVITLHVSRFFSTTGLSTSQSFPAKVGSIKEVSLQQIE